MGVLAEMESFQIIGETLGGASVRGLVNEVVFLCPRPWAQMRHDCAVRPGPSALCCSAAASLPSEHTSLPCPDEALTRFLRFLSSKK